MCFYYMKDVEWTSMYYVGYQCIYNANRLCEDIIQRNVHICRINFAKQMERNLHETISRWKTYGK